MYLCGPGVVLPWVLNGFRVLFVFQMGRMKEKYRSEQGMVRGRERRGTGSEEERLDEMVNAAIGEYEGEVAGDADKTTEGPFGESTRAESRTRKGLFDDVLPKSREDNTYVSPFGEDPFGSLPQATSQPSSSKAPLAFASGFTRQKHMFLKLGHIIFNKWVIISFVFVQTFAAALVFLGETFIYEESMSFDGCGSKTLYGSIWFTVYALIHFTLMALVVVGQRNMRERFMLKWESRLILLGMLVFGLVAVVWTFLPSSVAHYFPSVWFTFFFFTWDVIITGWIPTIMTLKSTYGFQWVEDVSASDPTKIKSLMTNRIMRNFFMDFCQKEFSLENPNFWLDVHYFHTVPEHQRTYVAYQIIETYFRNGSPMEINIPSALKKEHLTKMSTVLAAVAQHSKTQPRRGTGKNRSTSPFGSGMQGPPNKQLERDFFDDALVAVENNMLDTFSRYLHNEKYSEMLKALESENQHLKAFSAL